MKVTEGEVCIWYNTKDCEKSGLRNYIKKKFYDGKSCKCFAYVPDKLNDK
jgi:hypothetical protein